MKRYFLLILAGVMWPKAVGAADEVPSLWADDVPVPTAADLEDVPGVTFHVIKRRVPDDDGYNWLHGVALARHRGKLWASFGHNAGAENTASEVANGRVSSDGGATWGPLFQIDDGAETDLAVSHGVLHSHQGRLWAFQGAFYGRMRHVHTRAYRLDETTGKWEAVGVVIEEGFWPMQQPQQMEDGNWIMAGLCVQEGIGGGNNPAGVAISHRNDFSHWDLISIPKPETLEMWGESTVIVDGPRVLNIARFRQPRALISISHDFGRTWSMMRESNLPMTASKPSAGTLSTGQHYLIGNTVAKNENRRWPLTIALTRAGELQFRKVFRIRSAIHTGPGESHPQAALAYPYAIEHDGHLYVAYSNNGGRGANRNSAELAIIPVASLAAE